MPDINLVRGSVSLLLSWDYTSFLTSWLWRLQTKCPWCCEPLESEAGIWERPGPQSPCRPPFLIYTDLILLGFAQIYKLGCQHLHLGVKSPNEIVMKSFFGASLAEASIALPVKGAVRAPGAADLRAGCALYCNLWTPSFHWKRMASNLADNLLHVNLCIGGLSLEWIPGRALTPSLPGTSGSITCNQRRWPYRSHWDVIKNIWLPSFLPSFLKMITWGPVPFLLWAKILEKPGNCTQEGLLWLEGWSIWRAASRLGLLSQGGDKWVCPEE